MVDRNRKPIIDPSKDYVAAQHRFAADHPSCQDAPSCAALLSIFHWTADSIGLNDDSTWFFLIAIAFRGFVQGVDDGRA
jgi:hypothetical protein